MERKISFVDEQGDKKYHEYLEELDNQIAREYKKKVGIPTGRQMNINVNK